MNSIEELNNRPGHIKKEILDYADFLVSKYNIDVKPGKNKWLDISDRGNSIYESASETVIKMREEEK